MKKIGFVFPGQGSQSVGMLADIAKEYPTIQETFKEASEALGYDLWQIVRDGPAEKLDKTTHTQPALLAASYALWSILYKQAKRKPTLMAGHSLGEYTALLCAQALSFPDAVRLVDARSRFMQETMPEGVGGLAAFVGLEENTVRTICQQAVVGDEVLAPANFNTNGQIVIAGHLIALEKAVVLAKEAGAKIAKILPVSVPSHCILMKTAAERLSELLATITIETPKIPVISNVDVAVYDSPAAIRDGLTRQLYLPVRWVETIQTFIGRGVTYIVECGPGKVLTGLNRRIAAELTLVHTSDLRSMRELLDTGFEIE